MAQGEESAVAKGGSDSERASLSDTLADAVAKAALSVVRVDDGSRLTATGVIWQAENGVIVTTSHGVERDEEIAIETADGTRHAATLAGRDADTDLAVLRVEEAASLPTAIERAEGASEARVGQIALALGRPGEAGLQATLGVVSAKRETQTGGAPEFILQTDAALLPGFSGGPLIDARGRMLGLANRLYGRGGLGVALGTPLVARVTDALLAHGRVRRGYLGVRTQLVPLPDALRSALGVAQERALLVVQVESGSPAEQAGLFLGDILLTINGQSVQDVDQLRHHLRAGEAVTLQIARGGSLTQLAATVGTERE